MLCHVNVHLNRFFGGGCLYWIVAGEEADRKQQRETGMTCNKSHIRLPRHSLNWMLNIMIDHLMVGVVTVKTVIVDLLLWRLVSFCSGQVCCISTIYLTLTVVFDFGACSQSVIASNLLIVSVNIPKIVIWIVWTFFLPDNYSNDSSSSENFPLSRRNCKVPSGAGVPKLFHGRDPHNRCTLDHRPPFWEYFKESSLAIKSINDLIYSFAFPFFQKMR